MILASVEGGVLLSRKRDPPFDEGSLSVSSEEGAPAAV
jgi:hypothetical protein